MSLWLIICRPPTRIRKVDGTENSKKTYIMIFSNKLFWLCNELVTFCYMIWCSWYALLAPLPVEPSVSLLPFLKISLKCWWPYCSLNHFNMYSTHTLEYLFDKLLLLIKIRYSDPDDSGPFLNLRRLKKRCIKRSEFYIFVTLPFAPSLLLKQPHATVMSN